jgi:hypothetical protein
MKTADILAAMKATGGRLLKNSDPELYAAELGRGSSIQFLPRTSQPSEQKDSDLFTNGTEANVHGSKKIEDIEDESSDDSDGEACPFCGQVNHWGEMQTCPHNIGIVIDNTQLDSTYLSSIWSKWSELCDEEVHRTSPIVLSALGRHLEISQNALGKWKEHADDSHRDLNLDEFLNLCIEVFGVELGSVQHTEGMLSGSVYCIYVPNPVAVIEFHAALSVLLSDLRK